MVHGSHVFLLWLVTAWPYFDPFLTNCCASSDAWGAPACALVVRLSTFYTMGIDQGRGTFHDIALAGVSESRRLVRVDNLLSF